jgi:metal-responsive CopG/Arc/MetJ family transcriptional regulator
MSLQIAIRLPDELARDLDWVVHHLNYDSRAEVMREALVSLVRAERRKQIDDELVAAYTNQPQTEKEIAVAERNVQSMVDAEPWEKWW